MSAPTVPPVPPAPDLASVLDDVAGLLARFIRFSDTTHPDLVALYVAATYRVAEWAVVPYMQITSPEPDSGKSTLAKLLKRLSNNAVLIGGGASPSWMFRKLDAEGGATLIVDEMDNLWKVSDQSETKAALSQVLNCGFDRELAYVGRSAGQGSNLHPEEYACFGFKIIVGIGDLPTVVGTRTLAIPLQRALPGELAEHYRPTKAQIAEIGTLAASLAAAVEELPDLSEVEPEFPDGMTNRIADLWLPLLVIADQAGGLWPVRAREAAEAILADRDILSSAAILRDLAAVVPKMVPMETTDGPMLATSSLVDALKQLEGRPWAGDGATLRPLGVERFASLVRGYQLRPQKRYATDIEKERRGLLRAELEDRFARYLPLYGSQPVEPVESQPVLGESGNPNLSKEPVFDGLENPKNPYSSRDSTGSTGSNPYGRDEAEKTGSTAAPDDHLPDPFGTATETLRDIGFDFEEEAP